MQIRFLIQLLIFTIEILIVYGGSYAEPMAFRRADPETADGATPSWIVADGEITSTSAKEFRNFLIINKSRLGPRQVILLNSFGGSLFGGVALGEVIREFGLGTRIGRSIADSPHQGNYITESEAPGVCLSACAFAFLGGKWRTASDRTLGVHQHYSEDALREPDAKQFTASDLSAQQLISGFLADYIVRMGVDARFLTRASITAPKDIYLFTSEEMQKFGITINDLEFTPWALEPYRKGLIAISRSMNNEFIATLFCRNDKALRLLIRRPIYGAKGDIDAIVNGATVELFGVEIPTSDIKGKNLQDSLAFEFKLPPELAAGKIVQTSGMGASGPFRQLFYYDLPSNDFGTFSRLVNRNCI